MYRTRFYENQEPAENPGGADFAKNESLTLVQCIWGIFIEKYQVLNHFGIVRALASRCHGA